MVDGSKVKRFFRYAMFSTDDPSARYAVLAFWIIIIIIVFPYFVEGSLGLIIFSLLVSFVLISAVFSITGRSKYAVLALILIIPAVILQWTYFAVGGDDILTVAKVFSLCVMALVTFSILLEVVKSKSPIPRHIIWGAVAGYLLIGLTYATLFHLINLVTPGSFIYGLDPSAMLNFSDFVYFSFVTLATLGYGDIVPITDQARSLAILEAITGALYLAILIAKLVSLSIVSKEDEKRN